MPVLSYDDAMVRLAMQATLGGFSFIWTRPIVSCARVVKDNVAEIG